MRFVAGRGAAAKSYREDAAGRSTVGELLAGALRRSCCRQGTVGTEDCRPGRRGRAAGRGAAVAEILLARSAEAELLAGSCRKALRHKKRE